MAITMLGAPARASTVYEPGDIDLPTQTFVASDFSITAKSSIATQRNFKESHAWVLFSEELDQRIRIRLGTRIRKLLAANPDLAELDFDVDEFLREAVIFIGFDGNRPVAYVMARQLIPFAADDPDLPAHYDSPLYQALRREDVIGLQVDLDDTTPLTKDHTAGGLVYKDQSWLFTAWAKINNLQNLPEYQTGTGLNAGTLFPTGKKGFIVAEVSWLYASYVQWGIGYKRPVSKELTLGLELRYTVANEDAAVVNGVSLGLIIELYSEPGYLVTRPLFNGSDDNNSSSAEKHVPIGQKPSPPDPDGPDRDPPTPDRPRRP